MMTMISPVAPSPSPAVIKTGLHPLNGGTESCALYVVAVSTGLASVLFATLGLASYVQTNLVSTIVAGCALGLAVLAAILRRLSLAARISSSRATGSLRPALLALVVHLVLALAIWRISSLMLDAGPRTGTGLGIYLGVAGWSVLRGLWALVHHRIWIAAALVGIDAAAALALLDAARQAQYLTSTVTTGVVVEASCVGLWLMIAAMKTVLRRR